MSRGRGLIPLLHQQVFRVMPMAIHGPELLVEVEAVAVVQDKPHRDQK